MKRLLATLALTTALAVPSAYAVDLARSGNWTAFRMITDDMLPMCGMKWMGSDRIVMIKYAYGDTSPFVHLVKVGWLIPEDASMPLEIKFGNEEPFKGTAEPLGNGIGVTLSDDSAERAGGEHFLREFMTAKTMQLRFPSGSERPWVVDLKGAATIGRAFMTCSTEMDRTTTQPHMGKLPPEPKSFEDAFPNARPPVPLPPPRPRRPGDRDA